MPTSPGPRALRLSRCSCASRGRPASLHSCPPAAAILRRPIAVRTPRSQIRDLRSSGSWLRLPIGIRELDLALASPRERLVAAGLELARQADQRIALLRIRDARGEAERVVPGRHLVLLELRDD